MAYKDVREWIEQVERIGELKVIEGADWNLEIGALSVLASKHKENSPALLFDCIKDYPKGYRILVGFFESLKRSALTTNLPLDISRDGFIQHGASVWPSRSRFRRLPSPVDRCWRIFSAAKMSIYSNSRCRSGTSRTAAVIWVPVTW